MLVSSLLLFAAALAVIAVAAGRDLLRIDEVVEVVGPREPAPTPPTRPGGRDG